MSVVPRKFASAAERDKYFGENKERFPDLKCIIPTLEGFTMRVKVPSWYRDLHPGSDLEVTKTFSYSKNGIVMAYRDVRGFRNKTWRSFRSAKPKPEPRFSSASEAKQAFIEDPDCGDLSDNMRFRKNELLVVVPISPEYRKQHPGTPVEIVEKVRYGKRKLRNIYSEASSRIEAVQKKYGSEREIRFTSAVQAQRAFVEAGLDLKYMIPGRDKLSIVVPISEAYRRKHPRLKRKSVKKAIPYGESSIARIHYRGRRVINGALRRYDPSQFWRFDSNDLAMKAFLEVGLGGRLSHMTPGKEAITVFVNASADYLSRNPRASKRQTREVEYGDRELREVHLEALITLNDLMAEYGYPSDYFPEFLFPEHTENYLRAKGKLDFQDMDLGVNYINLYVPDQESDSGRRLVQTYGFGETDWGSPEDAYEAAFSRRQQLGVVLDKRKENRNLERITTNGSGNVTENSLNDLESFEAGLRAELNEWSK